MASLSTNPYKFDIIEGRMNAEVPPDVLNLVRVTNLTEKTVPGELPYVEMSIEAKYECVLPSFIYIDSTEAKIFALSLMDRTKGTILELEDRVRCSKGYGFDNLVLKSGDKAVIQIDFGSSIDSESKKWTLKHKPIIAAVCDEAKTLVLPPLSVDIDFVISPNADADPDPNFVLSPDPNLVYSEENSDSNSNSNVN